MFNLYINLTKIMIRDFARNRHILFFVFVFPLMFLVIFEAGSSFQETYRINVSLVKDSDSRLSADMSAVLQEHPNVSVHERTYPQALESLRSGADSFAIVFSPGGRDPFKVVSKGKDESSATTVLMDSILFRLSQMQNAEAERLHYAVDAIEGKSSLSFKVFVIPGLLALALLQIGTFGTAMQLIAQKEDGTLKHFLIAPMPKHVLIAAHITLRFLVICVQVIFMLAIMTLIFGEKIYGSWIALALVAISGGVMLASVGYFIAGLAINQQIAAFITNIFLFVGMFFGQIVVDLSDKDFFKHVILFNPVTYVSDACRQIILASDGVLPLWIDLAAIFGLTLLFTMMAAKTFRFHRS